MFWLYGRLILGGSFLMAIGGCMHMSEPASHIPVDYAGKPFADAKYRGGAQKIPGQILCAYYDLGGQGVAYHVSSAFNQGSGHLNPLNGDYLNEFRHDEAVGISYTKFGKNIDDNPFNVVTPPANLLYVGWTEPGEWFNLSVDVSETGTYVADILYTSNRGAEISFDVNGQRAGGNVVLSTTNNAADPIAWRQWHHWNLARGAGEFHFSKGLNLLTVHIEKEGNINLATLDFRREELEK